MGISTAKLDTGCSEDQPHSLVVCWGNSCGSDHSEAMFEREESHWLWLGEHSWWRHSAFFSPLTQQMHSIILREMEPRSSQSKRFLCLSVSYVLRHDALNPGYLIGVNFSSFHKILGFGAEILSHNLFWVGPFTLDTYKNPLLLWFLWV